MLLISIATFGHGSYSANILTIPGDIVPHHWVGTLYGMTGFAGGFGSIFFMQITGKLVDVQQSFNTLFIIAGYLAADGLCCVCAVGKKDTAAPAARGDWRLEVRRPSRMQKKFMGSGGNADHSSPAQGRWTERASAAAGGRFRNYQRRNEN